MLIVVTLFYEITHLVQSDGADVACSASKLRFGIAAATTSAGNRSTSTVRPSPLAADFDLDLDLYADINSALIFSSERCWSAKLMRRSVRLTTGFVMCRSFFLIVPHNLPP